MNLQQLYYFRTLAEVKHFTKAAMKLMVTQPSLSHSISDLEAELGIALFVRTNRMVTLTKYGELFLEYVDQSLNLLDEGRARLEDFISPEQGVVSLHYVSSIDPFVPYLVARYFQENKGLQTIFQFQQTSNVAIQNALLSGEETAVSLGINVRRLTMVNMILCCLTASVVVSYIGLINFIGLVAPHIVRLVVGNNHVYLIPGSALAGAVLLLLGDLFARVVISPVILPIGAITSFLGGPLFLYLLFKGGKKEC